MKHLFVLSFIIAFIFFGHELAYAETSPWWTHITYNFQHANIAHLLLNSISFFYLFRALQRFMPAAHISALAVISGFVASFFCIYDVPTVGSSGMIYAMLGALFYLIATKKIKFREKSSLVLLLLSSAAFLTMGFISPDTAGMLHLVALVAGFITQFSFQSIIPSYRRYRRKQTT